MSKLWAALIVSFFGHILAWFHMQGQFKYEWAKSIWWVILGGIPISIAFYYGTRWYYDYFQSYWYVRPIGFGMATLVFTIMTWLMLHEVPDTRTIITMFLSVIIIVIQLSHLIIK
jgi:hypothetical protein